ncbi:hypothetical protein CY35_01G177900 [Sphagnum magellanicum]|nr:hypothetical protein CY35_01G177900 [Sphagnum magellanicum]
MRNVVTEASLSTQASQWWAAVPSVTASIVFLCSTVYALSLVFGYDSFDQVCLSPYKLVEHFQVYRPYSSVVFHGSILHLVFNMLALVPIGSGLERLLGSVRYLHVLFLLTTSNALIQVAIAYIAAYIGTIQWYPDLLMECSIGFSGVIFAMIVIETSLSTSQTRSIFGFFTVNAKWYPWVLLVLFQLLMPRVSLLGHLSGILSGFAYTYGLFHWLLLSPENYSAIEGSHILARVVRRTGFIVGGSSGGYASLSLPSFSPPSSAGPAIGRAMNRLRSWMPQARSQPQVDEKFPGRGHVLGSSAGTLPPTRGATSKAGNQRAKPTEAQSDLQTSLLDESHLSIAQEQSILGTTSSPIRTGSLGK